MNLNGANQIKFPDHIAVIGGGRWARVLTEVLCTIVSASCKITIYTPHNTNNMSGWATNNEFAQHVKVTANWPCFQESEINAAIVVNAARDHESAIEKLLSERVPVLVEKPVTLTAKATQRLINIAIKNNTYFAAAHIFLFTSYLDNFLKLVNTTSDIAELVIHWKDPHTENRYGENKRYDPGLPIIADLFPHIMSILSNICPETLYICNSLDIGRGGASLTINLTMGNIPCRLILERNGENRQRILSVKAKNKNFQLDFTEEPGLITFDDQSISGDENWKNTERPSSLMLKSFCHSVTSGIIDKRIDIHKGLHANYVIDQAMILYHNAQAKWLKNRIKSSLPVDEDIQYAISEIFQAFGLLTRTELKDKLVKVLDYFSRSIDNTHLIQTWLKSDSPSFFFDNLFEQGTNS